MKLRQQVLDEPTANPVASLGIRMRRKSDGVTLGTYTTDSDGFVTIQMDGHPVPFYLQTTQTAGGPRFWNSDDHMPAGAISVAEIPHALRALGDGYISGFLGELAISLNGATVTIESGGALVGGYPVIAYSANATTYSRPASGTKYLRIVAQVFLDGSETPGEAGFVALSSLEAVPDLQCDATRWQTALATVTVPASGSLTLVDERVPCLASYVSRPAPVTGSARVSSASTSNSSGEALTGLGFNLVLPDSVTYDIEAELTCVQDVTAAVTHLASYGSFGSGTAPNFSGPNQIARRPSNSDVYVADTGNNRLVRLTSAGAYAAQGALTLIVGVAVDASDNVYVIRSDTNTTMTGYAAGLVSTLWNINWVGIAFRHVATDGTYLYCPSPSANRIYRIVAATGATLAPWGSSGAGDGQFNAPYGVATDGTYVYVVDAGNSRIQKLTTAGVYVTQWAIPAGARGLAYDGTNTLLILADTANNRLQRYSLTGTLIDSTGSLGSGDGQFNAPSSAFVDGSGNVWVSDTGNHRLQKLTWLATSNIGYGTVAVSIDGNISAYTGIGQRDGAVGNAHTLSVSGPATVAVAAYGDAAQETMSLNSCVISARAVPRL